MNYQRARPSPRLLAFAVSGIAWGSACAQSATSADGVGAVLVTARRSAAPAATVPVAMIVRLQG